MLNEFPVITDRRIRFGLVGCGRIAQKHLDALEKHTDNAEVFAICDINTDVLSQVQSRTGSIAYKNYEELLENDDMDCVILCTPSGLHSKQAIMAAQAGKHVVTEKPMATRWADGKAMVAACDDAGVRLFVVKQNRRNTTLQVLKRAIEQNRFGRIYMVNINVFWTRPQEYYDSAKWRGTWEFDGGALMNQASHYVDLIDWLIGPVASIHAYTGTLARSIEVEDTAVMNIRWRNGALGSMNVTMLAHEKNFEGSITILGENGTVRVGGLAVNDIQYWQFAEKLDDDENISEANYDTASVYGFGHPMYYQNVIETLQGKAEPETDGREGLNSLEILIATYLSARDGRQVSLPLEY